MQIGEQRMYFQLFLNLYSRVFAAALKEMGLEGKIMEAPNDCNTTATTWETGKKLFE